MNEEKRPTLPPESGEAGSGGTKRLVERLIKRGIESGFDALSKSPDTVRGVIQGMRVPKEIALQLLDQIDETKNGLYRAVAKEIRDFLQSTNFVDDARKILTGLAFEVKMEVRFKSTEDEQGNITTLPAVKTNVALKDKPTKKRRGE